MDPLHRRFQAVGGRASQRDACVARYGFAVPTVEALEAIERCSPRGVVDVGAGVGYWAHLLAERGMDVVAYDIEPPPSRSNTWHAGQEPWHPIIRGDVGVVVDHADRTLLLGWPTRNETWPATALELHAASGGTCVAYVGEPVGGRTGDDRFHAILGSLDRCYACAYRIPDAVCTCEVAQLWTAVDEIALPCWEGCTDRLTIYRRVQPLTAPRSRSPLDAAPRRRAGWRRRRRGR